MSRNTFHKVDRVDHLDLPFIRETELTETENVEVWFGRRLIRLGWTGPTNEVSPGNSILPSNQGSLLVNFGEIRKYIGMER